MLDEPENINARRYRGVAGVERRAERRARLIQAGMQVFGTEGYHGGTVRAVCAAAGLTERYFYESFANREELLRAIYSHLIDELRSRIDALPPHLSDRPEDRARPSLTVYFDLIGSNPAAARILLFEILGVSDEVDRLYRNATHGFALLLLQSTQPLLPAPLKAGLDHELIADGLVGAVIHIALRWVLSGYRQSREQVVDCCVAILATVARDLKPE
jgi:AcrR family transcriptional regulator